MAVTPAVHSRSQEVGPDNTLVLNKRIATQTEWSVFATDAQNVESNADIKNLDVGSVVTEHSLVDKTCRMHRQTHRTGGITLTPI